MKRILCLGDSNTFGYDPRSPFGSRYGDDVRWTARLQQAGREVVNLGQNGLGIPRAPEFPDLAALLRRLRPLDAVTVMLGSNDLLCGASAETAAKRMEALLRFLRSEAEGERVLLIAPPPMRLGAWVPTREVIDESVRLAEAYRRLAAELGVAFADAGDWDAALCFDGVHLSPEGHAAFAKGVEAALAAMGL